MKRDWEDIWGTVLQVYLGICILGWVLVIILNIIEMLNKQGNMKIDWDNVIATAIQTVCIIILLMFFMCGIFGIIDMATKL